MSLRQFGHEMLSTCATKSQWSVWYPKNSHGDRTLTCVPAVTTSRRSSITEASLIAAGRVPRTTATFMNSLNNSYFHEQPKSHCRSISDTITCSVSRACFARIESKRIPVGRLRSDSVSIDSLWGGGTMPKAYSADMRTRVIARLESGASRREAAEHYDVSASTAVIWVKCLSRDGPLQRQTARREHLAIGGTCGVFAGADRWAT
jgi:Homeodomain-like domain